MQLLWYRAKLVMVLYNLLRKGPQVDHMLLADGALTMLYAALVQIFQLPKENSQPGDEFYLGPLVQACTPVDGLSASDQVVPRLLVTVDRADVSRRLYGPLTEGFLRLCIYSDNKNCLIACYPCWKTCEVDTMDLVVAMTLLALCWSES